MPESVVWLGLAALPAVVGIMEVLKTAFRIPSRWVGLCSLTLAVSGGALYGSTVPELGPLIGGAQGVTVGLAAAGVWSTTKNVLNGHAPARMKPPPENPDR